MQGLPIEKRKQTFWNRNPHVEKAPKSSVDVSLVPWRANYKLAEKLKSKLDSLLIQEKILI